MGGAAFFDVDNTVLQGASIYHLARGLYERGLLTKRDIMRFGLQQARFRVSGAEHTGHMSVAREAALAFIKGRSVEDLTLIAEQIFDDVLADKLWPGTCALARGHLEAGDRVWLVTATPIEIARVIAARLGLTGALGTVAETADGVYTGRLVGDMLHGPAKATAVRELARREGLDLAGCSSYSDSANDIPLLSLTGYACAINPDSRLRAHARAHGWQVRDYRTGRKAVTIGIPAAVGIGAVGGAVAVRRRAA